MNSVNEKLLELEESITILLSEIKKSKCRLLDEYEAAIYLGAKASTLRVMRNKGSGPQYVKSEGLGVKYDVKDLDEYINKLPRRGGGII